jgi:hypothetical protein
MPKPVFEMTLLERLRDEDYLRRNWDMAGEDAAQRIEELENNLMTLEDENRRLFTSLDGLLSGTAVRPGTEVWAKAVSVRDAVMKARMAGGDV